MSLDADVIARHLPVILAATAGVLLLKAAVTALLLRLMGARPGTATEAGILLAAPSETTLIVLATAASAGLIGIRTEHFWQIVTALGLTVTPALASFGRRMARRVERGAAQPPVGDDAGARTVIIGFGRSGQLVADMLRRHGKPFLVIESDPELIAVGVTQGFPVRYGNVGSSHTLDQMGLDRTSAVILTMDEPIAAQRLIRRLRARSASMPILARARDVPHAAALYRAGASYAVPYSLEASLQLSEAALVDLGVAMGPVIASIHEKRDEMRELIMDEGELDEKPRLKSTSLRDHMVG